MWNVPCPVAALLAAAIGFAAPALAQDTDGDGVPDVVDNCVLVANAPPTDCDSDQDGYGNACDGDFDQSGVVNGVDFSRYFVPDYQAEVDSGIGSDMDCSGVVTGPDFTLYFIPQFQQALPGPSGLACAGMPPCP